MRKLTVTARQYNHFVFPYVAQAGGSKTDDEWETAVRVMQKLKDPGLTSERPLTAEEKAAKEEGKPVYPFRRLIESQATFLLEEDEWKHVKNKMREARPNVAAIASDDYNEAMQAVESAEEYKIEAVKADAEAVSA